MTDLNTNEDRHGEWRVPVFGSEAHHQLALLDMLFQHAPVGFGVVDAAMRYVRVNDNLAAINGVPAADHIGRTIQEVVPQVWSLIEPACRAILRGEVVPRQEFSLAVREGSHDVGHWVVDYYPVRSASEIAGIAIMVSDVTDFRQVQDALRLRTDLYAMISQTNRAVSERRTVIELLHDVCRIAVETGHFRYAWIGERDNDRMRMIASAGDDRGYMTDLVISVDPGSPLSQGPTGRAAKFGETVVVNDFLTSPATAPWHDRARNAGIAASAAFPLWERGRVRYVLTLYAERAGFFTTDLVATLSEITPSVSFALDAFVQERARQRDEAALRLQDRAIRAVSQGICITDARLTDNPIIFASTGFERMTGYAAHEIMGRNCRFLQGGDTDAEAVASIRRAINAGVGCTVELLNYRKDGTPFWNELTVSPVMDEQGALTHFVGVQNDVTERRQLEHQIRQVQKMEAVGQLASGMAHDFNNLLTVIGGSADLLLDALPQDQPSHVLALEIRKAGEHGAALTRQLLAFSRKQVLAPRALDLNAVVTDSEKMLRRLIGEDVILTTRLRSQLWPVRIDPGQVEQILINLAVNARDAMPTGGSLRITTGMVTFHEPFGALPPGDYVTLEVSDSGVGMDERTRGRVFEPFFTTKMSGKGTGLGLSTVHGIAAEAGGQVVVESEPGRGTLLRVYLPREASLPEGSVARHAGDVIPHGRETLLLVEDDVAVRALGRRILRNCGYTVLEAGDGVEAMQMAKAFRGKIHLLISDVVMPHLGGRELVKAFALERPDCKVLFLSGYTDDDVIRHGVVASEVAFLQKPYSQASLTQTVRNVLDGGT